MAKNRYLPAKQTPSPAPAHTVDAVVSPFPQEDDEDNDICPVCDGECTCDNKPRALPSTPLTMSQLSVLHARSASTINHSPSKPPRPSLKIKLTIPQTLLGKRRAPPPSSNISRSPVGTTFASEIDGYHSEIPLLPQPPNLQSLPLIQPKRRGRPPKAVVAARALAARLAAGTHAAGTLQSSASRPGSHNKVLSSNRTRLPTTKKSLTTTKRRRVASSQSSDKSDVDHRYNDSDDDDAQSGRFPTFVSASVLSSRASSSSESNDSSLSSFDSDSSMEAEEEQFILSEVQSRARVRRELLGDEPPKKNHNAWVIRPRKNSVGPDEPEMDLDSDATEDEEEDEEEDEGEDDTEETDGMAAGGYVGMATGWSDDDDESSFDADLFFANLSDSENSDGSSTIDDDGGEDGDQSDLESTLFGEASLSTLPPRPRLDSFEVTEGWDGQIVFTNGLSEGQGVLDMDFEATTAQFTVETSPSPSQESDAEMSTSDLNDNRYGEEADGGEGDTTDEELVGEDDLPNERAMRLFRLPSSVSAINPMSTVSPAVSPGPRDRMPFSSRGLDSPKPADILEGKFFWDSDDHDEFESSTSKSRSQSSFNIGPRAGQFEPANDARRAIIDGSYNVIPSPHPRFRRGSAHFSTPEHTLRKHIFRPKKTSGLVSNLSFLPLPSTAEEATHTSPTTEIVDLNEVLEASFLDTETSDSQTLSDSHKQQLKGVNRWDVISVGAFRQTQDPGAITDGAADWSSDVPASAVNTDYGKMMKSSPLSTMLWQNKGIKQKRSRKTSVIISPVILPMRDRDGDRTPTNIPPNHVPPHKQNNHPHKNRKELRRERKLKRKSCGSVTHQHQHHQRHFHQHHPNSKTRSTSSTQRMNPSSSSIPPLSL